MRRSFLLIQILFASMTMVLGQSVTSDSLLRDLAFYADVMVNADHVDHRLKAHEEYTSCLKSMLESPSSFGVSLDSIPWISVLHGEDFRIITWQLRISDEEYRYGGYIQFPDKLIALNDSRPWVNGSLRNTYAPGAWYGALYYKIMPFKSEKETRYILFGFNAENSYINTKVVDVLDISGNDPKFGLPVFTGKDDPQTRLILTYADASSVQLVFDPELNAIVHDHLENLPGVGPEGSSLAVSDGSQEGWFFKNGQWQYKEEVYDVKSEEPPMSDERKERKEDKDLFGRPKKEN